MHGGADREGGRQRDHERLARGEGWPADSVLRRNGHRPFREIIPKDAGRYLCEKTSYQNGAIVEGGGSALGRAQSHKPMRAAVLLECAVGRGTKLSIAELCLVKRLVTFTAAA